MTGDQKQRVISKHETNMTVIQNTERKKQWNTFIKLNHRLGYSPYQVTAGTFPDFGLKDKNILQKHWGKMSRNKTCPYLKIFRIGLTFIFQAVRRILRRRLCPKELRIKNQSGMNFVKFLTEKQQPTENLQNKLNYKMKADLHPHGQSAVL